VQLTYKTDGDPMQFSLTLKADGGHWDKGMYEFQFIIPHNYPFEGPKVTCVDKVYHPNIDFEGGVCVNVLRPWKPTYSVQIVLFGILFLFSHPNPDDPLNKDAAAVMRDDFVLFKKNVQRSMAGQMVGKVQFPRNRGCF